MFRKVVRLIIIFPIYFYNLCIDMLSSFSMEFKKISFDFQLNFLDRQFIGVTHTANNGRVIDLDFYTPNSMCIFRAESFSNKEPETLEWIEEFGKDGAVLFDIGANIGLYSIYHNKVNDGNTIAFEPSFFNLKSLLKNININNCQSSIRVITNPLSSKTGFSEFIYGGDVEGGALSAFGVDFGHDGRKIDNNLSCNVFGFSLDYMIKNGFIEVMPNLIKIDVDGIEHKIIKGAKDVLQHPECLSVLVEVNDDFREQADEVSSLLTSYGYVLKNKLHGLSTEESGLFSTTYNQIWVKG